MNQETPSAAVRPAVPALGTVLCAVDASPAAAAVLYDASGLAAHPGSRLLVHVDSQSGVRAVVTHGSIVSVIHDRELRSKAGVVVMGRDAGSPGRVASELLRRTHAIVVFVP